jgi:hypothetical protein
VRISIIARIESSAALVTSAVEAAGAAGLAGAPPLAGFGAGSIWVGSSPAVSASVSVSGQLARCQLGPEAVDSRPSNQARQLGSTDAGSLL